MNSEKGPIISVIGGNQASAEVEALAEEVGRELANRGAIVACGGLTGVMAAVCRGARAGGGTTIGILPGRDTGVANRWVDIPICTDMGYARNLIVVYTGRAVIALDGAHGTASEIHHALGVGIPVVGLNPTFSFSINGDVKKGMIIAKDPVDAVEKALAAARLRDAPASGASH